jgi:hypothetical protein
LNRSTALSVVATAAIALAACQSILGIQDVEVTDGAAPASDAAAADANPADSTPQDAMVDAAAPDTAADTAADTGTVDSSTGDAAACEIACASDNVMQVQDLLADGGGMCLCGQGGSGACAAPCAQTVCKQPPSAPDTTCLDCLAPAFLNPSGTCHSVLMACGMSCGTIGMCGQDCGAP